MLEGAEVMATKARDGRSLDAAIALFSVYGKPRFCS